MGTLSLFFPLFVLSAIANGNPTDCPESYGIPSDLTQVNGLWNVKAVSAFQEAESVKLVNYAYAEVSVNEVEANVTCSSNPIFNFELENYRYRRVDDQKVSLSYAVSSTEGDAYTLKFLQSNPESLIVTQEENNVLKMAFLYSRGIALAEAEVDRFKKWSRCSNLDYQKAFDIKVNYAQECPGLFEKSKDLEDVEGGESWGLIAKASSLVDVHYLRRILYEGKLEISREGDSYNVQEILTIPGGVRLKEQTYTTGESGSDVSISTFKTGKDLLLLGIRTKEQRVLFLASKRSKAAESVLETFEKQARCFEAEQVYLIPGSKTDNEACGRVFHQMNPMVLKESLGKWSLTVSAYAKIEHTVADVLVDHGWMDIGIENDKPHMSYVSIIEGSLFTLGRRNIELEDGNGHVTFKDLTTSIKSTMYRVSPNCIMFSTLLHSNLDGMVFLFCRSAQVGSADIKKFANYATCVKCNYIVIRKQNSLACLDIPHETPILRDSQLVGRWTVLAAASSTLKHEYALNPEVRYIVQDEKITIVDSARNGTITVDRKEGGRLHYSTDTGEEIKVRFYEISEDLLMSLVGTTADRQISLTLLSKSGHAEPADIDKFKHFASCLMVPVVFLKE